MHLMNEIQPIRAAKRITVHRGVAFCEQSDIKISSLSLDVTHQLMHFIVCGD